MIWLASQYFYISFFFTILQYTNNEEKRMYKYIILYIYSSTMTLCVKWRKRERERERERERRERESVCALGRAVAWFELLAGTDFSQNYWPYRVLKTPTWPTRNVCLRLVSAYTSAMLVFLLVIIYTHAMLSFHWPRFTSTQYFFSNRS